MTADRWEQIKKNIKETFKVVDEYDEELDPGIADVIEFESPQGTLKARFVTRPKVLGKKTQYSRRIGGDVKVDYQYSEDEKVCHLSISRWNESLDDWVEVRGESLF
jgi:hypothetical protein